MLVLCWTLFYWSNSLKISSKHKSDNSGRVTEFQNLFKETLTNEWCKNWDHCVHVYSTKGDDGGKWGFGSMVAESTIQSLKPLLKALFSHAQCHLFSISKFSTFSSNTKENIKTSMQVLKAHVFSQFEYQLWQSIQDDLSQPL